MKLQLRFHARQFIDAMSPSNFPATNPDVVRTAIQTRSASLAAGMQNLIEDLKKGRITRVDESEFEVGGNLAVTPGTVMYENELIQLIEYTPQTAEVEKTPLLLVPPCINKYYLLDLGEGNSFVEYAVARGHHVFLISWRSAVAETQNLTWDDYLTLGPLKAIDVVRDIAGVEKIHALGFCVGGTIMSCAAGVLAARGEDKLATVTLLTTMIDFSDTGEIGLLMDRHHRDPARGDDRQWRHSVRQGVGVHLRHAAGQRSDLALRGRQLHEGRAARLLRPAVLGFRQRQPAGSDVLLVHAQHLPRKQDQGPGARPCNAVLPSTSRR